LVANKEKDQAIAGLVFARRLLANFMIFKCYSWGNLRVRLLYCGECRRR
jgi:hypothetical protein